MVPAGFFCGSTFGKALEPDGMALDRKASADRTMIQAIAGSETGAKAGIGV